MSSAIKLLLLPLLVAQAKRARGRAPKLGEAEGPRSGSVGSGPLLRLLVVGDSSAAGVGVATQDRALALPLSRMLAARAGVRVEWHLVARTGLASADAQALLEQAGPLECDVAVVVLGVNDVIAQVPSQRAVAERSRLADWLLANTGARHVCFSSLPPMHQFPLLPQPLRWIAGRDACRLDSAWSRWAASRDDVSHVSIAIDLAPDAMAADGFHPGEPVYRVCALALARHVAGDVWPRIRPVSTPSATPAACPSSRSPHTSGSLPSP